MFKGKVLLFSLLLVFATSVYAGDVDDCESECSLSCDTMKVSICPLGDFEPIGEGCGDTDDYIQVIVRDASGNGIPGIPWSDYWMGVCSPDELAPDKLCLCCDAFIADSLTNSNGVTTISGTIRGGGCVLIDEDPDGIWISVQGKVILSDEGDPDCLMGNPICLEMTIKSVDMTADCQVNLSDLGDFGTGYNTDPSADPCADFNDDNKTNLSDFAFMGEHYFHECDACP
jgi:hypothetical protein